MKVDMIAEHSLNGKITPVRMRLVENGENKSFDVLTPVLYEKLRDSSKNTIFKYKAKIVINDTLKNIELYFCVETTSWTMKI